MQLPHAKAGVFMLTAQCRDEIEEHPKNRGLISRAKGQARPAESLLKGYLQRFFFMSFFRNRTAAAADGKVSFGSDSIICKRRWAWRSLRRGLN